MGSLFYALLVLSLYLGRSAGVTIGNRNSTTQGLRMPSVEPVKRATEPSPIFRDGKSNIWETGNAVDRNTDVSAQSGQKLNVAKVLRKRNAGKFFLHLVPNLINGFSDTINNPFEHSREEVENQGLTQEQLDILLLAVAESRCSGAGTTMVTNASVWMILSLVTFRLFLRI